MSLRCSVCLEIVSIHAYELNEGTSFALEHDPYAYARQFKGAKGRNPFYSSRLSSLEPLSLRISARDFPACSDAYSRNCAEFKVYEED